LPISGKGGSDWGYASIPVLGPLIGAALGGIVLRALGA
jgi:glycerol uptake facilitator protein